jgi:predicted MPP superfamily phosphohydrolase
MSMIAPTVASDPIRWLHLSDFHVGKDDYAQRKLFDRIIQHVRHTLSTGLRPDLVFITGDIANYGKLQEYQTFFDEFLAPLHNVLDPASHIYIVPGNHDVDRQESPYFSQDEICDSTSHFFDTTLSGKKLREQVLPRFTAYMGTDVTSSVGGHWIASQAGAFVDHAWVRGRDVGVVGINTAWLSKDNADRHSLTPGIDILEEALANLTSCDACIVLGHHPLDWFHDDQLGTIRSILGQYHAIYLHGHLHVSRARVEDGSGRPFLSVQCGVAFETRAGDVWKNGLLWGELDIDKQQLRLQPRHYERETRDWPSTSGAFPEIRRHGEWWVFPLPGSGETINEKPPRTKSHIRVPDGWCLVDQDFLTRERSEVEHEEALRFFDGGTPDWRVALSPQIPKRIVVQRLLKKFNAFKDPDRPKILLLLGAGGEGKSTAILQTISSVVESGRELTVFWREDNSKDLSVNDLRRLLPTTEKQYVFATDDADLIAKSLHVVVKELARKRRGDVRFLLACRDTDWIAAHGPEWDWGSYAEFKEESISGLDAKDALAIIQAWGRLRIPVNLISQSGAN